MSTKLLLYSSHNISDEELAEVILQLGGTVYDHPAAFDFGEIAFGQRAIGISPIPVYDGVFDNEGNPLSDEGFSSLERAKAIVGGEFQTWLYIHPNDLGLTIRFAHACCQRWPCVIETDAKRLYSCKEIEQLYQEEGGMI